MALKCMAIRTQSKIMTSRVRFMERRKEAATCARNARGYKSIHGSPWLNNMEIAHVSGIQCSLIRSIELLAIVMDRRI